MAKLPAFQFYPGDWRKDPGVQALSFHDRGVWFEILCLMHESDRRGYLMLNGAAMPNDALARLLGLDNQILTTTLTTLLTFGVASLDPDTGSLMSRRMVRDEAIRETRKNCGKMGGNPNLVNQKPTTQVNQFPTPSSSSSFSSSSSGDNAPAAETGRMEIQRIAKATYDAYPDFARKDHRTTGKGIDCLSALEAAVKARPAHPWEEHAKLVAELVDMPKNLSTWIRVGSDDEAYKALKRAKDGKTKTLPPGVDESWGRRLN